MKIALFDMVHWNKDNIVRLLQGHEILMFDYSIQEEDLEKAKDAECLAFFISSKLDKNTLDKFPNLKLVCTMSTGYDNIDIPACQERNIIVCNVPYYGENTVAEHAFGLLLAISKKIPEAVERTREFNFSVEGLEGFDLSGKTIGIVGAGHIGIHAIKIAKGFNMNVLAYDVIKRDEMARQLHFRYVSLDDLLGSCDIISVHVPYNEHTHHLINRDNVKEIKKGTILINTSRGAVIETEAIVWALDNKILKAVGLDVIEGERLIGKPANNEEERNLLEMNERLLNMKNVLVTPHSAFNTREALARIEETMSININKFLEGNSVNVVKY